MSALVPDEHSRYEFKELLIGILRHVAPDEAPSFEAMKEVSDPETVKRALRRGRTRSIPGGIEMGVVGLHLVTGTLALVEGYRVWKDRKDRVEMENDIRQAWQQALVHAGMTPELARLIPVKFTPDMIRFITKVLLDKPGDNGVR
ncbi:MAG: hypothetical protein NTZ56_16645 [Acidobacteria bacterium]|nr:hypothetical protein [Acidobacteriota bacterium]